VRRVDIADGQYSCHACHSKRKQREQTEQTEKTQKTEQPEQTEAFETAKQKAVKPLGTTQALFAAHTRKALGFL
jgi:hypothetical protein